MNKTAKKILIGSGLIIVVFTGIFGFVIYSVYSTFSEIGSHLNKPIPEDIKQTGVLKGEDFLEKKEIFKLKEESFLGTITESAQEKDEKKRQVKISSHTAKMVYGFEDIKACGEEIVAVGKFGGYVFGKEGKPLREIAFEPIERKVKIIFYDHVTYETALDDVRIYDFENDGKCEFVSHDYTDGVIVYNSEGNIIWRHGKRDFDLFESKTEEEEEKEIYVTGVDVGDMDNDGISEIIISQKNVGIRAFDKNKKEIWHQYDDFPTADFRFVDTDGDGSNELLELQGESSQIRDVKTGEVVKKIKLDGSTDGVLQSPTNKDGKSTAQAFSVYGKELIISDFEGKVLLKASAPLSEVKRESVNNEGKIEEPTPQPVEPIITEDGVDVRAEPVGEGFGGDSSDYPAGIYEPRAVWVKLKEDEPKYFAILGAFISYPRANLYVYTPEGKLVYHELLPEKAEAIAVVPKDNDLEEIVIGGKDTIWQFALK